MKYFKTNCGASPVVLIVEEKIQNKEEKRKNGCKVLSAKWSKW